MLKDSASSDVDPTKLRPSLRPDLSQSTSADGDSDRILTSLKTPSISNGVKHPVRKTSTLNLVFFLLAVAAAFVGYRYWTSQADSSLGAPHITKNESMVAVPVGNTSDGSTATPEKVVGAEPAPGSLNATAPAAQIVNEVQPQKEPLAANTQAKLTDALEKDVKPPNAALQKALESKPKQANLAAPGVAARQIAQKSVTAPSAAPKGTAPTADKDVNLIAALLAHNAANSNSKILNIDKPATTTTSGAVLKSTNNRGVDNASVAAIRPDIVEAALKQCQGFDFLQRELCKLKTCDKLWETNPACKATLSASKQ